MNIIEILTVFVCFLELFGCFKTNQKHYCYHHSIKRRS